MIKIKGFEKADTVGIHSWFAPGIQPLCTKVISRIFGALDPKATYEARFYGKKPKTEVVKLQIRKTPRITTHWIPLPPHFAIRKGKGLWHDVTMSGEAFSEIWDIAKYDGIDAGHKVRKFYVRLVETTERI